MSAETLSTLIFWTGAAQLSVLVASALTPWKLRWRETLAPLPRLHRQMHWVYGGYIVLSILAFGTMSLLVPDELASGSPLARGVCGYLALFWGVRLVLQGVFDVKEHLTTGWLAAGYRLLTLLFLAMTLVYGWAALAPAP